MSGGGGAQGIVGGGDEAKAEELPVSGQQALTVKRPASLGEQVARAGRVIGKRLNSRIVEQGGRRLDLRGPARAVRGMQDALDKAADVDCQGDVAAHAHILQKWFPIIEIEML